MKTNHFIKGVAFSLLALASSISLKAQVVQTAVPFLRIVPDAQAGAMGDAGICVATGGNSVFWNTAKIPFDDNSLGLSVNYSPWLRELVSDIYLASLGGYYKLDNDQAITLGFRYFSLGSITFTGPQGDELGDFSPKEYCVDAGYGRKLSKYFSVGLNLGFVYSNLASGYSVNNIPIKAGTAVKSDVSLFYSHPVKISGKKGSHYDLGLTLSNIGNKITYTQSADNKDFLPANLGLGNGITFQFDDYNKLSFNLDLNKLMVPTPDSSGNYRNQSTMEGIIGSFSDAPGGFSEELAEIMISTGAEYWYKNIFSVRAGYFYEDTDKGGRQYLTAGLGIKYNVFGLNFSYLVPTSAQNNPLDNTLRFSLVFDFDSIKKEEAPPSKDEI